MAQGRIVSLNVYPVKGCAGISLDSAQVGDEGLHWDRFWMIIDVNNNFVSQRQLGLMATIKTAFIDSCLVLSHDTAPDLKVSLSFNGSRTKILSKVWGSECQVFDEGEEASHWLTEVLGEFRSGALRLVRMAEGFQRQVSQNHTENIHHTHFADGYPILVTNTASLAALNRQLQHGDFSSVDMQRFRANIVIDSELPFIENQFPVMHIISDKSSVALHLCKPCERCKVIGIDQQTGKTVEPKQPLATLMSMDHVDKKGAYFGHNAVVLTSGEISLGQEVTFMSKQE